MPYLGTLDALLARIASPDEVGNTLDSYFELMASDGLSYENLTYNSQKGSTANRCHQLVGGGQGQGGQISL